MTATIRKQRHEGTEHLWYALQVQTGQEKRVADEIMRRAEANDMQDLILQTLVPEREVNVYRNGERRVERQRIFPSYVYVHVCLTDPSWYIVRNTPGVIGFVGTKTTPIPVPEEDMERIFRMMNLSEQPAEVHPGDWVQIIDGPFMFQKGEVIDVDERQGKAVIMIQKEWPIRATVSLTEIEKIAE